MLNKVSEWPVWYTALSIQERKMPDNARSVPNYQANSIAEQRLLRWKHQLIAILPNMFAKKLYLDGLTEDQFEFLLNESAVQLRNRFVGRVKWINELGKVFDFLPKTAVNYSFNMMGLAYLLSYPFILSTNVFQKIDYCVNKYKFPVRDINFVFLDMLLPQIVEISWRTLVLEVNIAKIQGKLTGENSEIRFKNYCHLLNQPEELLKTFCQYPILTRQISLFVKQWSKMNLRFLYRLAMDWPVIKKTFFANKDPEHITKLIRIGDPHRGRQTGLIIEFSSGNKLVYKPRSIKVDVIFQNLLLWLNKKQTKNLFKTIKMVDYTNYGWVEYLEHLYCDSDLGLERFYWRIGAQLAVLYLLGATDQHFENVIAQGEHPFFIDLETILRPRLTKEIDEFALYESVVGTGLLPNPSLSDNSETKSNLSGIGTKTGTKTPYPVAYWENDGHDSIRIVRKNLNINSFKNTPALGYNLSDYEHVIIDGFQSVYEVIWHNRAEIMKSDGLLSYFNGVLTRFLVRNTETYGQLLVESTHPDLLKSGLDKDKFLDNLWKLVAHRPELAATVESERLDLSQGDIPIFTTYSNSVNIINSQNHTIEKFFDQSGSDLTRQRLGNLDQKDLERQSWLIRTALSTPLERSKLDGSKPLNMDMAGVNALDLAHMMGQRLHSLVFSNKEEATWINLSLFQDRGWSLLPMGTDLYDGLPGIILFLTQLASFFPGNGYKELAENSLRALINKVQNDQKNVKSIGGFMGLAGIIYTCAYVGTMWKDGELINKAKVLSRKAAVLIERDEHLDISSGTAGLLLVVLELYGLTKSKFLLEIANLCGEHLVKTTEGLCQEVDFSKTDRHAKLLTGFAHGAAGISLALLALYCITKDNSLKQCAMRAINYERGFFSAKHGNWQDLRIDDSSHKSGKIDDFSMIAWCNGAMGIGLARLKCLKYLQDPEIGREIVSALHTTLANGFGNNHSLCHGDFGNLEIFLEAGKRTQKWKYVWHDLGEKIILDIKKRGWRCGIPFNCESLGFMTGIAGIGYGLLRFAYPNRVPSVLTLELPRL